MAFHILDTRIEWLAEGERPARGEALVIPANDHLWMLSGPGLELKRSLGKEVELEAVRQGPLEPGALAVTAGEKAGYRMIFHAVVMGQYQHWVAGAGRRAVLALCERAGREKLSSLAVFPLYRGIHGRREGPAEEMLSGFLEGLQSAPGPKVVSILFSGAEEKNLLHHTLVRLLGQPRG